IPAGVPADAVALALNITVTESSAAGFVTQFPAGRARPNSSVLNLDRANQTRAAAGIFPVTGAGTSLFLSGGGHVIVDITGYFTGPSAAASTDGLFTAVDPTRLLDTRGASPLGSGVPLYPAGGLDLAVGRGGAIAFNITAVDSGTGFLTAYPAGTARPATSSVNAAGDTVANFGVVQVSNRGLGVWSNMRTHALVDVQGWFSGPSAAATEPPPANTPPPTPQPSYSSCNTEGLAFVNVKRSAPLVTNAAAEAWACAHALQLAASGSLTHSNSAARNAAVGCGTGENIAYATGTSVSKLYSLWYNSAPHFANITNRDYRSMASAFVVRTSPDGTQMIWGVNVFALC
ncbi:MAG TPA: CAP domain-containing protein, partial [Ilumatobacteraceae bacterium]|nr:CAP domain-containing protein [Ilumatobacteraceae bacterium]